MTDNGTKTNKAHRPSHKRDKMEDEFMGIYDKSKDGIIFYQKMIDNDNSSCFYLESIIV